MKYTQSLIVPFLLIILLAHFTPVHALDQSGTQWYPYLEWSLNNPSWSGNAFDLEATVTFTHSGGTTYTTNMFYNGGTEWKFRFTGTQTGTWTYTTASSDSDLNSDVGTVTINPNPDTNAHGFMKKFGDKWGWEGTEEAFVPQFVMLGDNAESLPSDFDSTAEVDALISEYMTGHGFTGFHVAVLGGRWFNKDKSSNAVDSSLTDPDPETFEALELLITKTHQAGGSVHIWAWGDDSRAQTPKRLSGGANGTEDIRLQKYIAARLGALPGWSMGYGFDLFEWTTESMLSTWHTNMHNYLGWSHFLGARSSKNVLDQLYEGMDYSAYEWHKPSYDDYVDHITTRPGKPVFSEDRFRLRDEGRDKDYNAEETRRGLWHSTMAGGIANIWGNLLSGAIDPYPNKAAIKTSSVFFNDNQRFTSDMVRDNTITDGYCLKRLTNQHYLFYKEDTSSVYMDLSGMSGSQPAVAVDTKLAYAEINLGIYLPGSQTWSAPYSSDWAIAVGTFSGGGGGGNIAPTASAGSDIIITLPVDQVTLSGSGSDSDGTVTGYSWSKLSGGSASIDSPSSVSTLVTGLVEGSYTFQLTVTDDDGATGIDTVLVTVNPAGGGGGTLVDLDLTQGSAGTGTVTNGTWDNGWKVDSASGQRIVFDLGKLVGHGYAETSVTVDEAPYSIDGGDDKRNWFCIYENSALSHNASGDKAYLRTGQSKYAFSRMKAYHAAFNTSEAEHNLGSTSDWNIDNATLHTVRFTWGPGYVTYEGPGGTYTYNNTEFNAIRYIVLGCDQTYGLCVRGMTYKSIKIVDLDGEPSNTPPTVEAGLSQTITLPTNSVSLNGTVTDPDDTPVTVWSKLSGPGTVAFGNASNVDTTAAFSTAGTYVLELTADDGTNDSVSDTVTITVHEEADGTAISINFQTVTVNNQSGSIPVPADYLIDSGSVYDSGRGYGWSAANSSTRDRDAVSDQRLDTLIHSSGKTWMYDIANGEYDVTISVGDASYYDAVHVVNVEGETLVDSIERTSADPFYQNTLRVTVSDGQLTFDDIGSSNAKYNYVTITPVEGDDNQSPTAVAAASPISGTVPLAVSFTGSSSSDSDGSIVSYSWNFGDGSSSSSANPSHTYTGIGLYTAILTVTDDDGATDTDSVVITVSEVPNSAPVANNQSVSTAQDTNVNIVLSGSDIDGDSLTYSIEASPANGSLSGSAPNVTYTPDAGWFGSDSFTFTVNDGTVDSNTATISLTVTAASSDLVISNISRSGYIMALLTEGDQYYIDRSYTIAALPVELEGLTWIMTANNDKNNSASDYLTFEVNQDVTVYIAYDKRASSLPTFMANYSNTGLGISVTDGSASPMTVYSKSYTAGTITLGGNLEGGTTGAGSNYTVLIKGSGGGIIPPEPNQTPVAVVSADTVSGYAPLTVSFTGSDSYDSDGSIIDYAWDFMDGGTSASANPSHTFSSVGEYQVDLTVTDDDGDTGSASILITVTQEPTGSLEVLVASPVSYQLSDLLLGSLPYVDRSYSLTAVPAELEGEFLIRTANNDKNVSAASHLVFTVSQPVDVFVCYDSRAGSLPIWMGGYYDTGMTVRSTDVFMNIFKQSYTSGTITLGGNKEGGNTGAGSNYYVVVTEQGASGKSLTAKSSSASKIKIIEDAWYNPGDSDGDGLTDMFELTKSLGIYNTDTDWDGIADEHMLNSDGQTLFDEQAALDSVAEGSDAAAGGCQPGSGKASGLLLLVGIVCLLYSINDKRSWSTQKQ